MLEKKRESVFTGKPASAEPSSPVVCAGTTSSHDLVCCKHFDVTAVTDFPDQLPDVVQKSGGRSDVFSLRGRFISHLCSWTLVSLFLSIATPLRAADPPLPSSDSQKGAFVTNPVTGDSTKVAELILDPVGTSTAGATEFVITEDGFAFLVKPVGGIIYNNDQPPLAFTIVSQDTTAHTVQIQGTFDGTSKIADLEYQGTYSNLQSKFITAAPDTIIVTPPEVVSGASGVRMVYTGNGGSNGHGGALFVPPATGGTGDVGPDFSHTNEINISTTNQIGIEAGSVGGQGGKGGDSWLSFWKAADGGNGGAGGSVIVNNASGYQVATTGEDKYGIFAYSRSGKAGDGGSGYVALGGGGGGHSSNGGSVTINNLGNIITTGKGAFGIYGLSVSNNGGYGGSQWGIVGSSGDGGAGSNGGPVDITNGFTSNGVTIGSIYTSGDYAHGIVAQSIGGSGGSSGSSSNLIFTLQSYADNGGDGGMVSVNNNGSILTTGDYALGIFAESIGGGGGAGGSSWGMIALGGSGGSGGDASKVDVTNAESGSITTTGVGSDGIFAQSVGGSGGSSHDSYGLVSLGGSGAYAGDGGDVTVENYGIITTTDASSRGIVAQSIGGGGGDGGSSSGMVSVGGSGGGGGTGATVTVSNGGSITTVGADAKGIVAQSIGGGGGNGGSAGSVNSFSGVTVGGTAAQGGNGGNVNVILEGQNANTASIISTKGDRATALFAQSVGGGGGTGGGAVQVTGGFGGASSISLGGAGGKGGKGGTVTLSSGIVGLSNIQTNGSDAAGVFLQSVGGGGGTGGYAVSVAVSGGLVSGSLSVGIGGSGGAGGDGGVVSVGSFASDGSLTDTGFKGNILTTGARSTGFFAQSVGGGGGNGGLAVSAAGGGSLFFSQSIGIGIGGSGGVGGAGGAVSVATEGDITTLQDDSTGLLVQSVGGGGGNGGGAIAASLAVSGGGAGAISVGVGGEAGDGSNGGKVTVATRAGTISTKGENSTGILVQSVGGSGGNGGYSITAGVAAAGIGAGAVNVGLGGTGGAGGDGGIVNADLQSDVNTSKQNSTGILVQSVGGGGGNGGFNVDAGGSGAGIGSGTVGVGLGGSGGSGGVGNTVTASVTGTIATVGDNSNGVVAQSIGGGGGNGGFNVSAAGSGAGIGSGSVSVGLGGDGGSGNDGGEVKATKSTGSVTTKGDNSVGILAQSVGGGGGNGGFNISAAGAGAGIGSGTVSIGLGGGGGAAGDGKVVSLTVQNDVGTAGANSTAIIAQSIGGGGGNGGFNVTGSASGAGIGSGAINVGLGGSGGSGGDGGSVTATVTGNIETLLANSGGIVAQSIGGGGGNGGFNVAAGGSGAGVGSGTVGVGLGGSGGSGGIAGTVIASIVGGIATHGDHSVGFLAQSIGGGGGNGGFNISASGSGAGTGSGAVSIGLGGAGGTGNDGGTVTAITSTGKVTTTGDYSTAILAQSVGGGGGNGGFNISAAGSGAGTGSGTLSVGIGGGGGAAGNGKAVSLTVQNDVGTAGENSTAVIAQSIGGGGGNGGFNVSAGGSGAGTYSGAINVGLGGSGGSGGSGDSVTATVTGNIETLLANSGGFLAQSVGGGGGNGGFNVSAGGSGAGTGSGSVEVGLGGSGGSGGVAGKVTATVTGAIVTHGDSSDAFVAQSIGGGGGNGGFNVSAAGSGAGEYSGAISVGLGGSGGTGNNGGEVNATKTSGTVVTEGDYSIGILAQSIGGGGGNGGFNVSAAGSGSGTSSGSISVGLGGGGGDAGYGNAVSLIVNNDVRTTGLNSAAVIAQSIGGGGGNGGFNVSASGSGSGKYSGTITAGLGGSGGGGNSGGVVTATVTGSISTALDKSAGVIAQSVGGGGGNGGFSVAGALNFTTQNNGTAASITASVGGFGGAGGAGKDVTLTRNGDTQTFGDDSAGLFAQSIGGGGGNGGLSVTGSLGGPDSKQISASVGGAGGAGSESGAVTVTNTGNITTGSSSVKQQQIAALGIVFEDVTVTTGRNSDGILAQSIGGGGGNGGFALSGTVGPTGEKMNVSVGLTVGGSGGGGGASDDVTVINHGLIRTIGLSANGIEAQSIGGGGGNGGSSFTGILAAGESEKGSAVNISVSVGGMGGDGNTSGDVLVEQFGGIVTGGDGSSGILAQSIGGGGGNGGGANSLSLQLGVPSKFVSSDGKSKTVTSTSSTKKSGKDFDLQVDVGGNGGNGNNAGTVTVRNHDFITTAGVASDGILAQSIGGGGGNGGRAMVGLSGMFSGADVVDDVLDYVTLPFGRDDMAQGAGQITLGGSGGASGNGEAVNVMNNGAIHTSGADAYGICAQSIGGGGGIGGDASSSSKALLNVGGFGGASGDGGNVTVINTASTTSTADILTTGLGATAIYAQSVGGGGGDGGSSSGGLFAVGGWGGASGAGGAINVTNQGILKTTNDFADGIFAQSVGGGGGNAGGTGYGGLTISGLGGSAGNGGRVSILNSGTVITEGNDSIGLFGQSIGGGGGNGGMTTISALSIGASGGSSGNGGEVAITNSSIVSTSGNRADAIRAQSVGGGGGSAGGVADKSLNGLGLLVSIGGSGAAGGTGGKVSINNTNELQTTGELSNGIFAQSVGGGGGIGGNMIGAIALGGSQGSQGNGGDIAIDNGINGTIWTQGLMSNGIFAQSIGGGGGTTGGNVTSGQVLAFVTYLGGEGSGGGNGGNVTVDNSGVIRTDGASSQAILVQSIGGGGGNAQIAGTMDNASSLSSAEVRVGGNGGDGGNGGNVTVTNHETGTIMTNGANSTAIFVQSIGGGGGNGGGAITGLSQTMATTTGLIIGGNGADGGAGGNGGNVSVENEGTIEITANNSVGIMAQSVGGGGGTAGSAVGSGIIPVSIGGQNGIVGKGGDVSVRNSGSIIINGDNSIGVFAQSVGGGGGLVMPGGGASSIKLQTGGSGNGGIVTVTNNAGSIMVTGANSIALYSQSVGGGGGAVGLASDPPGQIGAFLFSGTAGGLGAAQETVINQTGNLIATGTNSIALTAQSSAAGGTGDIIVNILNAGATPSLIMGGSDQGAGVYLLNGADNQLNNNGIITTIQGVDGFAVRATTGNDHVYNTGTMIGSVDLGSGSNSLYNDLNARFASGSAILLGTGNLFTNAGLLVPGGCDRALTAELSGDFLQTEDGVYGVDLDFRNRSVDRISASGAVNVSGIIALNIVDPGYAIPGHYSPVILSANQGVIDSGVQFQAPKSAVASYALAKPNTTEIDLNYVVDYSPSGLTENQHAVGSAINRIQAAQMSPGFRPVAAALFVEQDRSTLERSYDRLSGEGVVALQQSGFLANDLFLETIQRRAADWIFSSHADGQFGSTGFSGAYESTRQPSQAWRPWFAGNTGDRRYQEDNDTGSAYVKNHGTGVALGVDGQVSSDVLIGFAAGYGRMSFDVPDRETSGKLDSWSIAGYGALRREHMYLSGAFAYDYFDNQESRHVSITGGTLTSPCGTSTTVPGFDEYLTGAFTSSLMSVHLEAGYMTRYEDLEVTPFAGFQFSAMHVNDFSEQHARGTVNQSESLGLSYNDQTVMSIPLQLGFQLKYETEMMSDTRLSLTLRNAWVHEFNPDRSVESSFISAPGFGFEVQGSQPTTDALLTSLGMSVNLGRNCTLFSDFKCNSLGSGHSYSGMAGVHVTW